MRQPLSGSNTDSNADEAKTWNYKSHSDRRPSFLTYLVRILVRVKTSYYAQLSTQRLVEHATFHCRMAQDCNY